MARTKHTQGNSPVPGFLPVVSDWFRENIGAPTAPQLAAWPLIQNRENVLIHSPTGTGKTFAAFLSAINDLVARPPARRSGVRVLYISPLKALNNDIERNLSAPLAGIAAAGGPEAQAIRTAVRTGDTTPSARAAMVRNPPDILITTPESLYLILTSPKARDILRSVETVIVDEIHTVSDNKRGTHLALSLERLERLSPGFQRIGLSATQRPVEEVARILGGQSAVWKNDSLDLTPRPVSIVDVDYDKEITVNVYGMPEGEPASPASSIWPTLIPHVLKDVLQHDTTLIFANSRRQAERTADRLNAQLQIEDAADLGKKLDIDPDSFTGGLFGTGHGEGPFRAHHASISEEQRRQMERDLKRGDLPALIGTSSLELGIDIGSIDLVVQLQSPGSVTQGLQRIGRSGHSVGAPSVGKIYATHQEDLFESALVARGITERDVEEIKIPRNALDVLSQQVIAAVSVERWQVADLFAVVRSAYPYEGLDEASFESVLRLISGKYPSRLARSLRARVYWDEVNGTLDALPGARLLALSNPGAIVDRGLFGVYLPDRKTRIGELDEEYVFETKVGDAFLLGSQVWRAREIDDDRVIVEPAPGAMPRMPFWRGEHQWRPFALSKKLADFRAELAQQMAPYLDDDDDPPDIAAWLRSDYRLDEAGARQLIGYVRRQLRSTGTISSSDCIVVETFTDPIGDRRMVVQSPFGGRVNAPWSIALASALKERTGVEPEVQVGDDGILFRFPEADEDLPVDVVSALGSLEIRERLLDHLADSALFGAVFRKNAYRALLLPGSGRGRRTPFWLQRLRAKDLLAVARGFPDFPIMLETFRDCLEDEMDLPNLQSVIDAVQAGEINIKHVESRSPSPVAQGLSFEFESFHLYEWDTPKAERNMQALQLDRAALARLFQDPAFAGTLRPEAMDDVVSEISRIAPGYRARTAVELAQLLTDLGDLTRDEIAARSDGDWETWLRELEADGRVVRISIYIPSGPEARWVAAPDAGRVANALGVRPGAQDLQALLLDYASRTGPFTTGDMTARYGLDAETVEPVLDGLVTDGALVSGFFSANASELEWADAQTISLVQRRTLGILRSEISPVSRLRYASEVATLQGVARKGSTKSTVGAVLGTLRGLAATPADWTSVIFPARLQDAGAALEEAFAGGEFVWVIEPSEEKNQAPAKVKIVPRATGRSYFSSELLALLENGPENLIGLSARLWEFMSGEGVATSADIRSAMTGESLLNLRAAVSDLVMRGLLTGNSWSAMLAITREPATGSPRGRSGPSGRTPSGRIREDRRRAARSIREVSLALPPETEWSTTTRHAVIGPATGPEERSRQQADALLDRYGVVSRLALELDHSGWDWAPIAAQLNVDELGGRARRGYFVQGLPGLQYAAPGVVESLRTPAERETLTLLNARDPANVLDRSVADEAPERSAALLRFNRIGSTSYALSGAEPILLAEDSGKRLTASDDPELATFIRDAMEEFLRREWLRPEGSRRIEVESWNGGALLDGPGEEILEASGFRREYPGMVYDALQARARSRGVESDK